MSEQIFNIRGIIEALLFVSEKPVTLEQIKGVLGTIGAADIKKAIEELKEEYNQKQCGMSVVEIAGGYQMLSNSHYATYIRSFYKTKHKEKLSKPALEVLAIIAYRQPVTRLDVELIRGVNSDGIITNLLEKELLKVVGRKDVPGKPYLYGTTKQFLEYFGLRSLEDLPKLEEFPNLVPAAEVLEQVQISENVGVQDSVPLPEVTPPEATLPEQSSTRQKVLDLLEEEAKESKDVLEKEKEESQ